MILLPQKLSLVVATLLSVNNLRFKFLSDPGKPGVRSLGPDVRPSDTLLRLYWCDSGWWWYCNICSQANSVLASNEIKVLIDLHFLLDTKCWSLWINNGVNWCVVASETWPRLRARWCRQRRWSITACVVLPSLQDPLVPNWFSVKFWNRNGIFLGLSALVTRPERPKGT